MKNLLIIWALILMSYSNVTIDPVDRIGVTGPLTFNKTIFNLAWTDKPDDNYYIQEYLPKDETVNHFNQMMSIFLLVGDTRVYEAVEKKAQELELRKKSDPTCNYMIANNPDKTEYMLDFVLGESENDKMVVEEFNMYRYKQVDLGNNKKGILVYAYSRRAYGDDIAPFFKTLKKSRADFLNKMIGAGMPVVNIKDI